MPKKRATDRFETELAKAQLEALKVRMNPHFIANALTAIRRMLYGDQKEAAIEYLTIFSRLIRTTLENASREYISLATELEYTGNYLEMENLRFPGKFETKITVEDGLRVSDILVPPTVFQPYIENAINHGLMHKETGGILNIRFWSKGRLLKCDIEDNGVGRKKAQEIESISLSGHTSLSEQITRERLALLNKIFNTKDFSVMTFDLTDERDNATGTRVEIQLPLRIIYS